MPIKPTMDYATFFFSIHATASTAAIFTGSIHWIMNLCISDLVNNTSSSGSRVHLTLHENMKMRTETCYKIQEHDIRHVLNT